MPVSVGIYDKSYNALKPRIDALALDIEIVPFNRDGKFMVDGVTKDPAEVHLDYLWLSPDLSAERIMPMAFELSVNCGSIKVLQTFNAGLDNPAYKQVAEKGVRICNSSAQAVAISEYVLAQVLFHFQPLAEQRELQAAGKWQVTPFREISRTNWLIIGYGPIGRGTADRAKAFGANITVVRRSPETGPSVDRVGTMSDFPEFLSDADVIVLACPLNDTTRGFAGKAFFDAVKPGAILINIARGGLIDDAELMKALDAGRLAGATLDVFHTEPLPKDDPLWSHPGVRMTSHTSFSGSGVRDRWQQLFLDNLPRFVNGETLINEVNPADL
jgi:phosphoglycerate dehydrogenase-like enzyme